MLVGVHKILLTPLRAFARDESGASITVIGLTLPAIIGAMALAAELSHWQQHHRALQNAVASAASAPDCAASCYTVTISDAVPLYLSSVLGYQGNTTVGNQRTTALPASAVATAQPACSYCVLALTSSGAQRIASNGAPKADLQGCNTMSNMGATCKGHNGYALQGSGLTIVFAGSNNASYQHGPSGSGTHQPRYLRRQQPDLGYHGPGVPAAFERDVERRHRQVEPRHQLLRHGGRHVTVNGSGSIFANDNNCAAAGLTMPRGGSRGTPVK